MNSLFVVAPYRKLGMWVFDDETVGLKEEPFVVGTDDVLDILTTSIPDAENGFRLIFSADAFPGYALHLTWRRPELSGNIYYSADLDREGWLCPALLRYFDAPPKELFAKCEPLAKPG